VDPAEHKKQQTTEIIVGILAVSLFVLIGFGMLAGAYSLHVGKKDFVRHAVRTTGTVVGFDTLKTGMFQRDQRESRVPVIRFETRNGEQVRFTVDAYAAWADYRTGDTVTVLYEKGKPSNADIQQFYELWFFQLLMALIGICFVAIPPYTIARHIRQRR
jgi:hypothetical protein